MTSPFGRLSDPTYFAENRLPAHSDHQWFADAGEAATGNSSFERSLNGLWKFHYAKNLDSTISGFEAPDFDCSGWDDIPVPAHIQLQGYDRPQYVNVQYPWDGSEQLEPGQAPRRFNPVGSYVTTFALDEPLADGETLSAVFMGAESALAVWLNGVYIGYAEDSFTPSEFDLTPALQPGENKLAAQVVRFSSGSWIEDQDFFRFSGLFRDVVLRRRPKCHVEDVRVTTELADSLDRAEIRVKVRLTAPAVVTASLEHDTELSDTLMQSEASVGELTLKLDAPQLWSAENPYLYDLTLDVVDAAGAPAEHIPLKVGVRRFGIEDGVLKINGQRIVFKGVDRHDFGPNGRAVTRELVDADIKAIKAANINAIRTSHYPNCTCLYELCDQYGVYVIDEMNLESHAMWDRLHMQNLPDSEALPGDRPEWLPVLLDRAASMLERDKNHACVIMWSCGNESYGGTDILAVSKWFHEHDSRPVHYEGVRWDPRYRETSDVESQMYTPASEIEEYLKTHRDKPFILCEYAHAMGNSFGAVAKYTELAYKEPLFQGGFIWDFADQAILSRDRYGQPYFGYGGDFGDRPADHEFSGDGIFFADHTPTPKIQEVRYLYQGFATTIGDNSFTVENRHLFTSTKVFDVVVSLSRDGVVLQVELVETDVKPGESGTYPLPFALPSVAGEYAIDVSYRLSWGAPWAPAGYEVGWQQKVIRVGTPKRPPRRAPELIHGIHNIGVRGQHFAALFSEFQPGLVSYRYGLTRSGGREMMQTVPLPNFWHAPTSNEKGWNGPARDGQWLLASRYAKLAGRPDVRRRDNCAEVEYCYELPSQPVGRCTVLYQVFGDGRIEVTETINPGEGLMDMPEFGMMFVMDADYGRLQWYGDGPDECYSDRRSGARLGIYDGCVAKQLTPYLRPQEAGSHTGVRWVTVTSDDGWGMRFECEDAMEFSALPWTPFEIENAAHQYELPPIQHTVLRPALARRGVGGDNSWGAMTHPEFCLPTGQPLVFKFAFSGVQ
ncbi:MAG: DUF4981 domain-containing protein [Propionibacteriaceae bacterium]|nr:DUF4981 domain-containing protein [Propionibacteriaceae bacterium]